MDTADKHQDSPLKGIALACAAFFLFTVMNASAKFLIDTHNFIEIGFWRCATAILPFGAYILIKKQFYLLQVKQPKTLLFRCLIGNLSLLVSFAAFKYIPLADATLIFLTSMLITPVFAYFFLNERIGPHRWVAIIIALLGVALVAGPTGSGHPIGYALAICAAISYAAIHVLLRIMKGEHSIGIAFYFMLSGTIMMGAAMPFVANPIETIPEIIAIAVMGVSGALAQCCLTFAFKYGEASSISPFNATGLLWATIFDIILWSYVPGWPVFAGGAIIIASKLYILHRERINAQKR